MVAGIGEIGFGASTGGQARNRSSRAFTSRSARHSTPARRWTKQWSRLLAGVDLLVVCAAAVFATWRLTSTGNTGGTSVTTAIGIAWMATLTLRGSRSGSVLGIGADEYKRVADTSMAIAGVFALLAILTDVPNAAGQLLFFIVPGTLLLLGTRWIMRRILHARARNGAALSSVVIVGQPDDVRYVVSQMRKKSAAAYRIVAVVEEYFGASPTDLGVPVMCGLENIHRTVANHEADAVVVAGQLRIGAEFVRELGWQLESSKTDLILASSLTNVAGPRIRIRPVEGLPLMYVDRPSFSGARTWCKRSLDLALSSLAAIVLLPLLAVIAIAIKIDSAGPAIYSQTRIGRDGAPFTIYKFRTMCQDADRRLEGLRNQNEGSGPLFKIENDPRVTHLGKFLRRTSLDELPQLFNVLQGAMSLVGPRPQLPTEVETYEGYTYRRLLIRPGLTGLWQVNGRSLLSWDESVRLDLYYVENWSVTGDLLIMWHTAKAMVRPVGAF